jgi:hypothetical protein
MSTGVPQWLEDVSKSYSSDDQTSDMITKLVLNANSIPNFSFQGGLLKYKNKIWIAHDLALQQRIITALHSSPLGGAFWFSCDLPKN